MDPLALSKEKVFQGMSIPGKKLLMKKFHFYFAG
jgi:hypothetical protein